LSASARFCDQCGTPVAAPAPAADTATRKVVTVLFADLVGSTSFGERVDAESAREAMADYHAMARDAIEAAGGSVTKFIGDGVMALFGVPETAEDDADRAVAAGLTLQRGFVPIRDRVGRRHDVELGLRVGINTGEIVLADGDADLVGDAINVAARLEAACTPGEVLVGEETWRLTRSRVEYEVLGEVDVKGRDEAVATFRVLADAVEDDEQATPFVGRVEELARLRAVFDEAVGSEVARLATVIGAPGVGKTRIAREFCDSVADTATVAVLRCERAGTATFAPVADLLRTVTTIDDEADADQVRAALQELVADLDDGDRVADLLASFLGAAPARSTEEAFLAVRRLVEAAGRRRPLVVVVDDIQWAEPLFLDLLEHLADWVRDAPAMLVGLARPELRELRPSLAEESRTLSAAIGLEGLDAAATAELAARLVGAESLPPELVARLPASTEGNPLFVRELMRMLVDDGVIEEADGGWQLTIDVDAVEVPSTIQSLLAARLDRMPADERRVVELAAVVGPEFPLGAVAAVASSGTADLRLALDRLRRRELVESTGMYWGDEPIYRFHHVLIRDAAYRRLLKRARADLHLRVGEWTERTAADLPGEHEVAIAYHFEQAHEYRRQLDDVDDAIAAVGRRAAELLGAAAERSLERDDLPAASSLAERALARLDDGDETIPAMLVVAAEALLALGDVARGRPVAERLTEVVGGDERLAPWAESFEAQLSALTEPDRLHVAEEQADRAAARLAELGDEAGVAKARLVRAGALARLGQIGRAEAELDLALTAARSAGDRRRVAAVLGAAPIAALWGPSPIPRAGGRCLDVIRLLRITTGSPAVEATSVRCQAVLGLRHALGETDLYTGIVELLAGEAEAAEPPLRAAYQGLGRLGIGADAGQAAAYLARAVLQQGRLDEAETLATESAELAGENPQTAISARTAQAEILAAQGRYDEAVAVASDAVARAEGTDIIVDHAAASAVLAQVAGLAGDTETAGRAARVAADLYEQKAATVVPSASSATTAVPPEPTAVPPDEWNRAARLSYEWLPLWLSDEDAHFARMADDVLLVDHRSMARVELRGREAVRSAFEGVDPHGTGTLDVKTIATHGDDLVLVSLALTWSRGREGPSIEFLSVVRWTDDDLCNLHMAFDVDDMADALAALDRLGREAAGGEHESWNEADRLTRRFIAAYTAGAREEWIALLAPDQVTIDRRPLVGVDTTGADGVADAWPRDPETGALTSTVETVAVRGESFALVRWKAVSSRGREWDLLHLTRWNADGLNDLNVIFPADQLAAAIRELDFLVLESIDPSSCEAFHVRDLGSTYRALRDGDLDAAMDLVSERYVQRDHRGIGWPTVDKAGMRERLSTMVAAGDVVPFLARIHRIDGPVALCQSEVRVTGDQGAEQIDRHLLVATLDLETGQIETVDQFSLGQIDEAVAGYEETVARDATRDVRWNQASMVGGWIATMQRLGRPDLAAGLCVDGVQAIDAAARRVLAVRSRLAVVALLDVDEVVQRFVVEELDRSGRLAAVHEFDADDLVGAANRFDRRWLESRDEPTECDRLSVEYLTASRSRDVEALAEVLHDDYLHVDHRQIGFPPVDRDDLLQIVRSMEGTDFVFLPTGDPEPRVEFGAVIDNAAFGTDAAGRLTQWLMSISVSVVRDGRFWVGESFSLDDRELAIARFHELTGGTTSAEHEPWNEADRLMREVYSPRLLDPSRGDWSELLAPDLVEDDRRAVVGKGVHTRAEVIELWSGQQVGPGFTATFETIAVRGERLALFQVTVVNDGFMTDFLTIDRFNEAHLLDRMVRFDVDQLGEAYEELGRLYREELGDSIEALQIREFGRGIGLLDGGDVDGFIALHDPSFVMRDHRQLGWPELDLAGYRERLESIVAIPGEAAVLQERVVRLDHTTSLCAPQRIVFVAPDGTQQISRSVMVMIMDPYTGLITRFEQFEEDQVEEAAARFDELMAERGPVLHNEASLRASFVNSWLRQGYDDFIGEAIADGAEFVDEQDEPFELSAVDRREVMAVRGERLALVQLTGPDHAFAVEEIDEDGKLSAVRRFAADKPGLTAAMNWLDERWEQIEDVPPAVAAVNVFTRAHRARDAATIASVCAPEFLLIDHRPLGFEPIDHQTLVETIERWTDDQHGVAVNGEWLAMSERGGVGRLEQWRFDADGALTVLIPSIVVVTVTDGRITGFELCDADDPAAALTRFDELTLSGGRLDTAAVRGMREVVAALNDHSFVRRRGELTAPGYTHTDHRPIIGHGPKGVDELIGLLATAGQASLTYEPLAVRGDRFVLWRGVTTYETGGESAYLGIAEAEDDGRVIRTIFHEIDELDAAFDELDERWFATLDPDDAETYRILEAWTRAYSSGDEEQFGRLMADEFVLGDHRPLGFGELDRNEFMALFRSRSGTRGEAVARLRTVHHLRDGVMAASYGEESVGPDGAHYVMDLEPVSVVRDGRVVRSEFFESGDVEAVVARAEELVALGRRADDVVVYDDRYRLERVAAPGEPDVLVAVVTDEAGTVADSTEFPADREGEARQHLLVTWLASLNQRRQQLAQMGQALGEAWVAPSEHSLDDVVAPNFELVDGRTLGMGTLDRAGFEDALRGRESDGAAAPPVPSRVQFVSDDVMVFRANNVGHAPGSGVVWEEIACNVMVADGDRIVRLEMFDEDHWDDAVARARELVVVTPRRRVLENAMTRLRERFIEMDGDLGVEGHSEDFVREDRRSTVSAGVANRAEWLESLETYREMGAKFTIHPAIAIRGERFALFPNSVEIDGMEIEALAVDEVDDAGRLRRDVRFDPDDFEGAFAELDRSWAATLPEPELETALLVQRYATSAKDGDDTLSAALTTDDFVAVDHRPLGFGEVDKHAWIDYQVQRRREGPVFNVVPDIFHLSGRVWGASTTFLITTEAGSTWEQWLDVVIEVRDGKVARHELFAEDQREAAIRRARELDAGEPPAGPGAEHPGVVVTRRIFEAWNERRSADEFLHDDFVREDRRAVVAMPIADRRQFLDEVQPAMFELGARWQIDELVATRGDRFGLMRMSVVYEGGSVLEQLVVGEFDEQGLIVRSVSYDPDATDEALDELDRRWLATLNPDDAETYRVATQAYAAHVGLDDARLDELSAPDFVFVDRRRLGNFGELDRTGYFEIFETRRETRGPGQTRSVAVHRLGDGILVWSTWERTTSAAGVTTDSSGVFLLRVVDGRVVRSEIWDDDQIGAALARAEELVITRESSARIENAASRTVDESIVRMNAGESVADLVADDFRRDDRRHHLSFPEHGAEELNELIETNREMGAHHSMTHLAVRGERFVLSTLSSTFEGGDRLVEMLVLGEFDEAGKFLVETNFEPERLDEAYDELDERWRSMLDPDDAETHAVVNRMLAAYVSNDADGLDRYMAPDLAFDDHRPLGVGALDRDGFLDLFRTQATTREPGEHRMPVVHRLADGVLVATLRITSSTEDRGPVASSGVYVFQVVDGRLVRGEIFDDAGLDDALARAGELIAGRGTGWALENAASRHVLASLSQFVAGTFDESSFTDDYVREDRRTLVSDDVADRDRFLESMRSVGDLGGAYSAEPLAIRGDRFSLCRIRIAWGEDWTTEFLLVNEVADSHRVRRTVLFDLDDLAAAQDELDRLYLTVLPDEQAATLRPGLRFRSAFSSLGTDDLAEVLAGDFVATDHRPVAWPELDREAFIAANRERHEVFGETLVFTTDIHSIEGDTIVASNRLSGRTPDSDTEWLDEFANIFVVRNGQLRGLENFGAGDLDAAMARAGELAGSATPMRHLGNLATRWFDDGLARGDEFTRDDFAADFVRDDRRAGVNAGIADRDGMLESLQVQAEMGATYAWEPIATRGDRLGLGRIVLHYDDNEIGFLIVAEMADDTRIRRMVHFDPADGDGAFAELEERYVATLDPGDAETRRVAGALRQAYETLDVERLEQLLAPDFEWVDRRELGFGAISRAQYLAAQRERKQVMGDGRAVTTDVPFLRDGVTVSHTELRGRSPDSGVEWLEELAVLLVVRDGLIVRRETFGAEDLDAALARAEDLATDRPPLNAAGRMMHRLCERWNQRRHTADLLAADFVRVDRRPMVGMPDADRESFADVEESMWALGAQWPSIERAIATRGDRFIVAAGDVEFGDGESLLQYLTLLAIGTNGEAQRLVLYEPEQVGEAIAELDEFWMATLEPADAETYRVADEYSRAYFDHDEERVRSLLADDDVTLIDHRPLGFGSVDRDGLIELIRSRPSTRGVGTGVVSAVHHIGDGFVVASLHEASVGPDGAQFDDEVVGLGEVRHGRIVRHELFAAGEVEGAVARALELVGEAPS
jgi:class 3 adenylate cyclase/ketosteroid isomerase-like protein